MSPQNDPHEVPSLDKERMGHSLRRAAIIGAVVVGVIILIGRSEERRVGKECLE